MKKLLLFLFVMMTMFCSCEFSERDGDWERMKWKKNDYRVILEDNVKYCYVPAEGGTYTFHCMNYPGLWIGNAWYEQENQHKTWRDEVAENPGCVLDWHHYSNEWLDVKAKDGGILEVVFQPNAGSMRKVGITVTAGDIFYTFYFMQSRGK